MYICLVHKCWESSAGAAQSALPATKNSVPFCAGPLCAGPPSGDTSASPCVTASPAVFSPQHCEPFSDFSWPTRPPGGRSLTAQKKGTQKLPRLVLDRGVLKQYLQDSTWTTGLAADVGGGLMMIFVVTRAPISVIQPISSSGLAVLAVFSHFYLHEHMSPFEWAAVALSGVGIVIMGITAAEQPATATEASVPGTQEVFCLCLGAAQGSVSRGYS